MYLFWIWVLNKYRDSIEHAKAQIVIFTQAQFDDEDDKESVASSNYISNSLEENIAQTYNITLIEDGEVEEEDAEDAPAELEEGSAWVRSKGSHHLSVKKGARPVKQGQRRFQPELIPLIEGEVNKLIEVGFIREVKYRMWISSIVSVRKKNGQIRVCVDFRDLNNACPKDDFPLPIVELMIDATTGYEALSFMDGSSGYNQIRMAPTYEELTAFRTPRVFECLRIYQLKMNPSKCAFGVTSGKFLRFIVRQLGIEIEQAKIDAILRMPEPRKIHELKSLQGKLAYLRRTMTPNELKYSPIEKLCLALIFSIQKLKHYFQSHTIHLVSKANPLKYVMAKPVLSNRLARWYLQLQQFEITYVPQKAVKGQVLAADFLADYPMPAEWELSDDLPDEDVLVIEVTPPWKMYFDGASHKEGAGAGVVFVTSEGEVLPYSFTLIQNCSNNVAEYQALILGLEIVVDAKQLPLKVYGDSQLVVNQLLGLYEVK
ncbi:UNVERIFIED_CONTAM: Transposon Tf2-11 polyprotein [Sesamum radiatum]|uniref:Transposon Tf2-11 polyprotein n=1 Tax=Sesamum radiatum TaxID=300843 RepID=A0AAW2MEF0_SESRA